MPEVHKYSQISSIKPRQLERNVTTEFSWEVTSLEEHADNHIRSERFDIHGTEGNHFLGVSVCVSTDISFNIDTRAQQYTMKLPQVKYYNISVEARIMCDAEEITSTMMTADERRLFVTLLTIPFSSPLGLAIKQKNGFRASVRLTPVSAAGVPVATMVQSGEEPPKSDTLANDLKSICVSGEFTDVTLKSVEGDAFPAHRVVLAARSPVFHAMFCAQMKESQSGVVDINASSASVRCLLDYVYSDGFDENAVGPICFEVFDLGTQYELARLVGRLKEHMICTLSLENVVERFRLAVRHSVGDLREKCRDIMRDNLAAVMNTEGWQLIRDDPSVMVELMSNKRRCENEDLTPRKLKRLRSA